MHIPNVNTSRERKSLIIVTCCFGSSFFTSLHLFFPFIIPIVLDIYYYHYYFHFFSNLFVILIYLTSMSGSRLQERGSFECIRGSTSCQVLLVICFVLVISSLCIMVISGSRLQERGADWCFIGSARLCLSNVFFFIFLLS